MPLSSETVRNSPLSGRELMEVIVEDLRETLVKDGMFSEYAGYGRVGYEIRVTLHMDNLTYPDHQTLTKGGEALPLADPSEKAVALDLSRERQIESPNAARILNGLPIKATSIVDGRPVEHEIRGYDPADVPAQPPPLDHDFSQAATEALRAKAKRTPAK